jgi:hypothetical protein
MTDINMAQELTNAELDAVSGGNSRASVTLAYESGGLCCHGSIIGVAIEQGTIGETVSNKAQ